MPANYMYYYICTTTYIYRDTRTISREWCKQNDFFHDFMATHQLFFIKTGTGLQRCKHDDFQQITSTCKHSHFFQIIKSCKHLYFLKVCKIHYKQKMLRKFFWKNYVSHSMFHRSSSLLSNKIGVEHLGYIKKEHSHKIRNEI